MEVKALNEHKLFEYLKKWFPDLEKSTDQYSHYDCYSRFFSSLIELKCRRTHYDELILERIKYDHLIKHKDRANLFYINSTPKGIYLFDVAKIVPNWRSRSLPKTTDFKNNTNISKEYTLINIKDAINLE